MKKPAKTPRPRSGSPSGTKAAFDPYDDTTVMIGSRFRGASGTRASATLPASKPQKPSAPRGR